MTDAGMRVGGVATNHEQSQTNVQETFVSIFVPPKGTLTDAGDGDRGVTEERAMSKSILFYIYILYYIIYPV